MLKNLKAVSVLTAFVILAFLLTPTLALAQDTDNGDESPPPVLEVSPTDEPVEDVGEIVQLDAGQIIVTTVELVVLLIGAAGLASGATALSLYAFVNNIINNPELLAKWEALFSQLPENSRLRIRRLVVGARKVTLIADEITDGVPIEHKIE